MNDFTPTLRGLNVLVLQHSSIIVNSVTESPTSKAPIAYRFCCVSSGPKLNTAAVKSDNVIKPLIIRAIAARGTGISASGALEVEIKRPKVPKTRVSNFDDDINVNSSGLK